LNRYQVTGPNLPNQSRYECTITADATCGGTLHKGISQYVTSSYSHCNSDLNPAFLATFVHKDGPVLIIGLGAVAICSISDRAIQAANTPMPLWSYPSKQEGRRVPSSFGIPDDDIVAFFSKRAKRTCL
jgi:hypothetical protein